MSESESESEGLVLKWQGHLRPNSVHSFGDELSFFKTRGLEMSGTGSREQAIEEEEEE